MPRAVKTAGFERAVGKHREGRIEALKPSRAIRPIDGLAMIRILFVIGLAICGIAAGLLFLGAIEPGVAALIGIVGIGLMGSSAVIFTPNGSPKGKKGV
jgi:hypothetical protein